MMSSTVVINSNPEQDVSNYGQQGVAYHKQQNPAYEEQEVAADGEQQDYGHREEQNVGNHESQDTVVHVEKHAGDHEHQNTVDHKQKGATHRKQQIIVHHGELNEVKIDDVNKVLEMINQYNECKAKLTLLDRQITGTGDKKHMQAIDERENIYSHMVSIKRSYDEALILVTTKQNDDYNLESLFSTSNT
ncbi:unnamed protein product [Rotaria socialis]|uniref:Uncharacterized protein n=2 Tax=Rotaria socialis TaxID=392032 RepID=A0A821E0T1_9BILA|nr:unnamed protein product [Rotaria socialis]CAF4480721.1 unnamed protein product [Rotaria socialis]CAF4628485.1 unnamed protein product [Rotaria socialis]CAF4830475.1 unnamed protein product [Rotaria socialis]